MLRGSHGWPVAILAVLLLCSTAQAYLLPADFLLRLLAEKRRGLNVKDLTAQLTAEIAGTDAAVDEHLYLKFPQRLRLVRQSDDGPAVLVEREGQMAQGTEKSLQRLGQAANLTSTLLVPAGKDLDDMGARLLATLSAAGISTGVVALGRMGDRLAYIIGARPWEPDKPQLWLDKTTFQPLRFIVFDKSKSPPVRHETRFLEFGSSVGGEVFPGIIEELENGHRVRRAELTKLSVNQALPETLFDLPKK